MTNNNIFETGGALIVGGGVACLFTALKLAPRFGLYRVDYASYSRTPTAGATVLAEIASSRRITAAQRSRYGGLGPMTPEDEAESAGSGRSLTRRADRD